MTSNEHLQTGGVGWEGHGLQCPRCWRGRFKGLDAAEGLTFGGGLEVYPAVLLWVESAQAIRLGKCHRVLTGLENHDKQFHTCAEGNGAPLRCFTGKSKCFWGGTVSLDVKNGPLLG